MSGATGPPPPGLEIKKASYGYVPDNMIDVTTQTKTLVHDGALNFTVSANAFGIQNPSPGTKNTFNVLLSVNGGPPMNLDKSDGELFQFSAPDVKNKKEHNHPAVLAMSLFYFALALLGAYITYSSYRLLSEGMGISWLGYLIGGLLLGFFLTLGSSGGLGIFGLLVSSPIYFLIIPGLVFAIVCYNYIMYQKDGVDFSYALKAIKNVTPEIE